MNFCKWCSNYIAPSGWKSLISSETNVNVCGSCLSELKETSKQGCNICQKEVLSLESTCSDCLKWENKKEWQGMLTYNRSLFYYNSFLKELIAKFKYRGDYELIYGFATCLQKVYLKYFAPLEVSVVPIPLSTKRKYIRGFNQAEAISTQLGVPVFDILSRIASDKKQSKKTRRARFAYNDPMFACDKMPRQLINKKVLLVDDIYTTGATLRHAAKVLKENGTRDVYSLTIARS